MVHRPYGAVKFLTLLPCKASGRGLLVSVVLYFVYRSRARPTSILV